MLSNKTLCAVALALAMLLLVFATALAQSAPTTYIPLVAHNAEQPTSTPAIAAGVVVVADLAMPFNVLGGVDPSAVQDARGDWYISVFRIDSGANNGLWILRWQPSTNTITPIGLATPAQPALFEAQDAPVSNSRGIVAHSFDAGALYVFGWLDAPGGSRRPKLRVAQVTDYKGE
jgi:hypothetical protein